ncbi:hypothetical protein Prudu_015497 [Prunus dulcis]|uniref:DUF7876 domain-containing protein n=1 Tax=Prunus dulcis TaxID=3755 RepID=A0A4Y1RJG2_PRUDU|nr:hypothetical protein Prudu_015497 [Prunus dulcis]
MGVFDVFYYDPLQCRMHDSSSSDDDEYRSSRNIAISLFRRYRNVVDRGGGANLKEFISAGVNAYALGCTDEGLRKELVDMKESGVEIEGMQSYGGTTSLKSKIASEEVEECILWLSIIFITILCTPQPTIVRWSSTPPVSDEERLKLPVKTLQLEQMAVVGHAEEPSVVASRMRLVFSTLEDSLAEILDSLVEILDSLAESFCLLSVLALDSLAVRVMNLRNLRYLELGGAFVRFTGEQSESEDEGLVVLSIS